MTDRTYYTLRAATERKAAMNAASIESFRAHMALAREYEWRAATEPFELAPERPKLTVR